MLRSLNPAPRRILMTLDAVGGVFRYAVDLARGLAAHGCAVSFVGQGPRPSPAQDAELRDIPDARLFWLDEPLDWMASGAAEIASVPARLADLAEAEQVDLLHLNLPSQAAGLSTSRPVVVVSHSCVVTWWDAVRAAPLPPDWAWHRAANRAGFDAADAVLAPSESHAAALERCYGRIDGLSVVRNGVRGEPGIAWAEKKLHALAVGRWWDDGKNGAVLDAAAALLAQPVIMAGPCAGPQGQSLTIAHAQAPGALPHERIRAMMAEAAIVVSPSRYEPFGLAAVEGGLAGAALVLADIPTYRELWDGAALFAAPDDPQAFAAAIRRLVTDAALRGEWAARASARAQRYTPEAQLSRLLGIYDSVLGRSRATPADRQRRLTG
jgi:glycosyltransferase involved in cell wall biosynthesis